MAVKLTRDLVQQFEAGYKGDIPVRRQLQNGDREDNSHRDAIIGLSLTTIEVEQTMRKMWEESGLIVDSATRFGTYPFSELYIGTPFHNGTKYDAIYNSLRDLPGCPQVTKHTDMLCRINGDVNNAAMIIIAHVHKKLGISLEFFIPMDTINNIGRYSIEDFLGGILDDADQMKTLTFMGDFVLTLYFDVGENTGRKDRSSILRFIKIYNPAIADILTISNICIGDWALAIGKPPPDYIIGDIARERKSTEITSTDRFAPVDRFASVNAPLDYSGIVCIREGDNRIYVGVVIMAGRVTEIYISRLINQSVMRITPKQIPIDSPSWQNLSGASVEFTWTTAGLSEVMERFTIRKATSEEIVPFTARTIAVGRIIQYNLSATSWVYSPKDSLAESPADQTKSPADQTESLHSNSIIAMGSI